MNSVNHVRPGVFDISTKTQAARILLMALLLLLAMKTSAYDAPIDLSVKPPIAEDFIPQAKRNLPKHLEFHAVKLKNVAEMGKSGITAYKCELLIEGHTKEPMYIMKGFKDGKYQLQESTQKGTLTGVNAMAIVVPSHDGVPNIRVIMMPDTKNKGKPLSQYRKGSYTIIDPES